jgi:FkbM family methyltransferase
MTLSRQLLQSFCVRLFGVLSYLFRRWPFNGGQVRIANLWLVRKLAGRLPANTTAVLRNGDSVRVNPTDFDGRQLALFGSPDLGITEACMRNIKSGDVFLDIGANHGAVGLMVADRVGESGHVHLFEPQQDLGRKLREAIHRRFAANLTLHPIGLLDEDGEARMWEVEGHSGCASFVGQEECTHQSEVLLPIRDVATYIPPLVQGRSWAAKIDVEGAEGRILSGLLRIPRLRFAVVECSHLVNLRAVWDTVQEANFFMFGFEKTRTRTRFRRILRPQAMGQFEDVLITKDPDVVKATERSRWLSASTQDTPALNAEHC